MNLANCGISDANREAEELASGIQRWQFVRKRRFCLAPLLGLLNFLAKTSNDLPAAPVKERYETTRKKLLGAR